MKKSQASSRRFRYACPNT
jgi:hypothetical protein